MMILSINGLLINVALSIGQYNFHIDTLIDILITNELAIPL